MTWTKKIIITLLVLIPVMFISLNCSSNADKPKDTAAGKVNGTEDTQPVKMSNFPPKLRIAYSPSVESGEVTEKNAELDKLLSEKLGIPVESSILTSYVAALEGLASGQFDCAMVNPLGYVIAKEKFPIEVILKVKKNGSTEYYSQILANTASGINTIKDLKGHTFAFVAMTSTSGHLFARNLLLQQGIDPEKDFKNGVIFDQSHDKVALDVMNGVFDAGATFTDVRERLKDKYPEIMTKTKVIAQAGPIPNETFCVREGLDPEFKAALIKALIDISKGVQVGSELRRPFMDMDKIQELLPAKDSDYDIIRNVIGSLKMDFLSEVKKEVNEKSEPTPK